MNRNRGGRRFPCVFGKPDVLVSSIYGIRGNGGHIQGPYCPQGQYHVEIAFNGSVRIDFWRAIGDDPGRDTPPHQYVDVLFAPRGNGQLLPPFKDDSSIQPSGVMARVIGEDLLIISKQIGFHKRQFADHPRYRFFSELSFGELSVTIQVETPHRTNT